MGEYGDANLPRATHGKHYFVPYGFNCIYFNNSKNSIFPFHNNYSTEKSGSIFYRRVDVSAQLEELALQIRKEYANSEWISEFNASNAFVITSFGSGGQ
jgi:hypothetical protein